MARDMRPTKQEMLKWQAEDVVRQAMMNTPSFKKAVRQTMKDLKVTQKNAVKNLKGKNSGR